MTDKQWQALCADISDRRGLKWEWSKIDEDVKKDIRKAWEEILKPIPPCTLGHNYGGNFVCVDCGDCYGI